MLMRSITTVTVKMSGNIIQKIISQGRMPMIYHIQYLLIVRWLQETPNKSYDLRNTENGVMVYVIVMIGCIQRV